MLTFLMASLPSLRPTDDAPMSTAALLDRVEHHLPAGDLVELRAMLERPPGGNSTFARAWRGVWSQFENQVRSERVNRIESPLHVQVEEHRGWDLRLHTMVDAAWDAPDPLRREQALLEVLWVWLEDRRRAQPYGVDDLAGYALQLSLLERRSTWKPEAGTRVFDAQFHALLDPVLQKLESTL